LAGREFNLYRRLKSVKPLDFAAAPEQVQIGMSLRSIVKANDLQRSEPKSETEKNQDLLAIGL
jgi:hypothetical protein